MNSRKIDGLDLVDWIAAQIRQHIYTRMEPGERLATEPDLSKTLGVSVSSLRKGVAILEQQGLVERRQGSGTYVTSGVGRPVAILVDHDISQWNFSYFYRRIMVRLIEFFDEQQVPHRFYLGKRAYSDESVGLSCRSILHDLKHNRFVGVVEASTRPSPEWIADLKAKEIPLVGVYGVPNYVSPDIKAAIRLGVDALKRQGCRRIVLADWLAPEKWMRGYFLEQIAAAGLSLEDCHYLGGYPMRQGAGAMAAQDILQTSLAAEGLLVVDDVLFKDLSMPLLQGMSHMHEPLKIAALLSKGSPDEPPFDVLRLEIDPDEVANHMGTLLLNLIRGCADQTCLNLTPVLKED